MKVLLQLRKDSGEAVPAYRKFKVAVFGSHADISPGALDPRNLFEINDVGPVNLDELMGRQQFDKFFEGHSNKDVLQPVFTLVIHPQVVIL